MIKKGVFKEVDNLPLSKKAMGSKVVLKEKLDKNRNHAKFKAHIVAQGYSQVSGIYYDETFLLVAKFTTLHVFLTLVATLDHSSNQHDRHLLRGKAR